MPAASIRRLGLTNFRSYRAISLAVDERPVVLVGPNGAGKTNLLEAISFLTPGRGLRRATLEDVAFAEGDGSWAISAEIEGAMGLTMLGTGIEPPQGGETTSSRRYRVDREPAGSAADFADHLRIVWLTPALDGLFGGPANERRRFLDRLVLAVDPRHSSRVSALERALRSRNRLLENPNADQHWLDAVEHETAELAIAVAAMRSETMTRLQTALAAGRGAATAFPFAEIRLKGWIENALLTEPAAEIEQRYRDVLRQGRSRDAAAGRTLDGPHLTDLDVTYGPKGIPAADASTGEQKAILIRLVLAHTALIADMTGYAPLLLLDEVAAHLDPLRRRALYDALTGLGAQVWMTGADPQMFDDIAGRAQIFDVTPGAANRR